MSQFEKLLLKLRQHPDDISFPTLRKILEHFGYRLSNRRGSHAHFQKIGSPSLTIPIHANKVKRWYVKDVLNHVNDQAL